MSPCLYAPGFTEEECRTLEWEASETKDPVHADLLKEMEDLKGSYREWMPLWKGGCKSCPIEEEILNAIDLSEMESEMEIFDRQQNLEEQLRIPHECRPEQEGNQISRGYGDVFTKSDTVRTLVNVKKRGQKYWMGESRFGKVYIHTKFAGPKGNSINVGNFLDMQLKYMGPHVQLPLRACWIHY